MLDFLYRVQVLTVVERTIDPRAEEQFLVKRLMNVRYVPLTPPSVADD